MSLVFVTAVILHAAAQSADAKAQQLAQEQATLARYSIAREQLKPLRLETPLVVDGRAAAIICHADLPPWRQAATTVQAAIQEATGVELPLVTDKALSPAEFDRHELIVIGHLDNHRHVGRLYHNFFATLDAGSSGREGYEIRTVHDPFGAGHNQVMVGGSYGEGTLKAARAFAELVRRQGRPGQLTLGRLLDIRIDPTDCSLPPVPAMTASQQRDAIADGRRYFASAGQARSATHRLADYGTRYHRWGDAAAGRAYRGLMLALLDYYAHDAYINGEGMRRYDRDFRDSWTHEVAILWDLHEESGLFDDDERLAITNLLVRLALECVFYQGWDRPSAIAGWAANDNIVHNHNTFPAMGVLFTGNYLKRHYGVTYVDDWLTVARGIFQGQKHWSKPLEDAAGYQWLPIIHTMIAGLAEGDTTFFDEGHARRAAASAIMAMDNAGNQAAYGDHPSLKSASGLAAPLAIAAWYYKDAELAWAARLAGRDAWFLIGQGYSYIGPERTPAAHSGVTWAPLPKASYDSVAHRSSYAATPNLPLSQVFDKLVFRGGWQTGDEYLLVDGFGRGNHMHFDGNAIISYAAGGEPLLVDGEYIKNGPKYHNSLVVIRDGQSELLPPFAGLGRADHFPSGGYSRTWVNNYGGATWTRAILWRRDSYLVVSDEVVAQTAGDYTLRCCWRPWGRARLEGDVLQVEHEPMQLQITNLDGAAQRLETMRIEDQWPIHRLSQQVSRHLAKQDGYRFLNVICASPAERGQPVAVRRLGPDLLAIGTEIVAIGGACQTLANLNCDAELVCFAGKGRLMAAGCRHIGAAQGQMTFQASAPVALEIAPPLSAGAKARWTIGCGEPTTITLASAQDMSLLDHPPLVDGHIQQPNEQGTVKLELPPGEHQIDMPSGPFLALIAAEHARLARMELAAPDSAASQMAAALAPAAAAKLAPAWRLPALDPEPKVVAVKRVTSSQPPRREYAPVERLVDGRASGSTYSAMWPVGVEPTITFELGSPTRLSTLRIREWRLTGGHDIGRRTVELSSDGFRRDRRRVAAPFKHTGEEAFGDNVNQIYELALAEKAQQVRLSIAPSGPKSSVYLAEVELRGIEAGAVPAVHALAAADIDGDGRRELAVAGEFGQIRVYSSEGQRQWAFNSPDHGTVQALSAADVDGDGRDELAYGTSAAHLALLSAAGKSLWTASPPPFRGLASSVVSLFPADTDGNGRPEIIAGTVSWQYAAYSAAGQMLWSNVIYAHSATTGAAADLDADGRDEVLAGCAYYQLNAIDDDGRRLWLASQGPEMTAVACGELDGKTPPEVLSGVDHGDLDCYSAAGKRLWRTNLGDRVTRLLAVDLDGDGQREVIASAASAHVFAINGDGSLRWRFPLGDGSSDVALLPPGRTGEPVRLAVTAGREGAVILDGEGRAIAVAATTSPAERVLGVDGSVVVLTADGRLEAFEIR